MLCYYGEQWNVQGSRIHFESWIRYDAIVGLPKISRVIVGKWIFRMIEMITPDYDETCKVV